MPASVDVARQDLVSDVEVTPASTVRSPTAPEQPASRRKALVVTALLILVAPVVVVILGLAFPGLVAPIVALAVLAFAASWPWLLCGKHL